MKKVSFALFILLASNCSATTIDDILSNYGVMNTIAGTGIEPLAVNSWLPEMEGGPAIEAELSRPHMTTADIHGNVYIADKDAQAIRLIKQDGTIHTIAGTNEMGFNVESGVATEVQLSSPNGLFTHPDGTSYILDLGNSRIRKLTTDGQMSTLFHDEAGILLGRGLWVSPDESLVYYSSGAELKKWTPTDGIEVYADGFSALGNIDIDPTDGNVVATDRGTHLVYRISPDGEKSVIAGNGDDSGGNSGDDALDVGLEEVRGVAFNPDGTYFLATHDGGQIWFVDLEDKIHLVIDGDSRRSTHGGDGELITTPGKKLSEIRAVTIAPNKDLLITEHDAGYIRRVEWIGIDSEPGDLNGNGVVDAEDIDLLSKAIRDGENTPAYDLNGDGAVNGEDRLHWVSRSKKTYIGDSNLDGEFNSNDFVSIFTAGEYEDNIAGNSTWATGDWNGDGDFTSSDFVLAFGDGGYELGPRVAQQTVPEPNGFASVVVGLWSLLFFRNRECRRMLRRS